jgi:hypothetical protein
MKVDRRQFGKLGLAWFTAPSYAGAGVTGRLKNADFIDRLIGASTRKTLGEGKTFPGPCTPF